MHTNFAVPSLVFILAVLVLVIYWTKKTLILIARSEKRYKELFSNVSDAVIVYEAVDNGNDFIIKDLNLSSERIEKIKREDVIGKSVLDVFPNIKEFGLLDVLKKVWQSSQPLKYPAALYKDDRISGWRENYVYKLSGGEIVLVYNNLIDEYWAKTFDSISDMVFIEDANSNVVRANKSFANLLKVSPEYLIGKKSYTLFHKSKESWNDSPFGMAIRDHKSHTQKIDDSDIGVSLLVTTLPLFDKENNFLGSLHIAKDIAKREEVDKLKDEFVSTVSHELRTPLSIIKEGLSLVLDEITGRINEKQKDVLTTAKNNIDRLAQIINDLLDISKIEAGKVELHREKINIAAIIEQVAQSFRSRFEQKGLELKVNVFSKDVFAYADKDKMLKVFTNLVSNSLKFTESGHIEISVSRKGKELMCIVEDTGIGISREDLPKVFTKFQQFGRTPGPGIKGTGLGLSIVKGIIELQGGKIWLESMKGKGSKFIFTLPIYTAEILLKDFIERTVNEIDRKDIRLSLILISLLGVNKLGREDEIQLLYDDIEKLIKNSLYKDANKVIRDKDYAVVLFDCSKENTSKIESKLKQTIEEYLNSKGLSDTVRLKFGSSIYPDDADSAEQLIQKCEVNVEGGAD